MKLTTLSLLLASSIAATGQQRADHYGPIGVMGDHLHSEGKLMVSYRYMFMQMNENFSGSDSLSDSQVHDAGFGVTPTDMDMEMHMFGLMYAPSDRLTFMAMINLVELSMNHVRRDGLNFKTTSRGLGDSSIGALLRLDDNFHAGLGLILPTADIEEEDFIPGPGETRLPYPMQLGSGSWGLAPTLTYRSFTDHWSFGAQLGGKFYLDSNSQGYKLGDRYELTGWIAKPLGDNFSLSLRATLTDWDNIEGRDEDLLPLPVPTARPDLRGGTRLDLAFGLNYSDPNTGINAGLEFGQTLWQDLDGPQLGNDWSLTAGVRFAF